MRVTIEAVAGLAFGNEDDVAGDEIAFFGPALGSRAGDPREPGVIFGGGNNNWETAIATSERSRARKKRFSIQGTGS
jgi:hypothetical protein